MNSSGNPQIRSLKPYSCSADSRAEKSGVAKSLSAWTWSGFAGVRLPRRPLQRPADDRSAGGLSGVDDGQCSKGMIRDTAIWRPQMPRLCFSLALGAITPLMGKTAHPEPQQPMESTGPKSAWQLALSRTLPPRPHHSVTISQQELP
jgi:hypothetical protein